jgi:hypothetical protein
MVREKLEEGREFGCILKWNQVVKLNTESSDFKLLPKELKLINININLT